MNLIVNEFYKPYVGLNLKCTKRAFEAILDVWENPESKSENVNIKDNPNCPEIVKTKTSDTTISVQLPYSSIKCGVERKVYSTFYFSPFNVLTVKNPNNCDIH